MPAHLALPKCSHTCKARTLPPEHLPSLSLVHLLSLPVKYVKYAECFLISGKQHLLLCRTSRNPHLSLSINKLPLAPSLAFAFSVTAPCFRPSLVLLQLGTDSVTSNRRKKGINVSVLSTLQPNLSCFES